jgi:hypothetical protein
MMIYADDHKDQYDWLIKADTDAWFSTPNFKLYVEGN